MKCYCIETDEKFIYCVENAENKFIDNIEHAWFKKDCNKFIKEYPININDKEILKLNFSRIGESMFKNEGSWEKSLEIFSEKCLHNNIEWYIMGSIVEAMLGISVKPRDIDIVTHVRDFYKIKELFIEYLIEPFIDNRGTWVVQYFGRICIDGIMLDIIADEKLNNENYFYENIIWKKYNLKIVPIKKRYEVEIQRKRIERIEKIKEYMIKIGIE
jgi:hypothetical protein